MSNILDIAKNCNVVADASKTCIEFVSRHMHAIDVTKIVVAM